MIHVYLAIKYHSDHSNRPLIETITDALAHNGYETICIARDVEEWGRVRLAPAELMRASLRQIDRCAIIVVELSEKGVGIGIEAGYAHAKGIPIVTIAHTSADISETLAGISQHVLRYTHIAELTQLFSALNSE